MFHRRSVSKAASFVFKTDPASVEELQQAMNDSDFKDQIQRSIHNPTTDEAKQLHSWLNSIVHKVSKQISFGSDNSSVAYSEMLALNRYSGSGALFLTLAPASWKYGLFYRFANPMQHNSGSIVGDDVTIPVTNNQRKALKLASPYGDVRMYVTLVNSIIKNIIGIPVDNAMNSRSLKPIVPVHCRPRGLLGQVAHFYAANETSAEGILHTHLKLYNTLPWDLLESNDPASTELQSKRMNF